MLAVLARAHRGPWDCAEATPNVTLVALAARRSFRLIFRSISMPLLASKDPRSLFPEYHPTLLRQHIFFRNRFDESKDVSTATHSQGSLLHFPATLQ